MNTRHYICALKLPPDTPTWLRSVTSQLAAYATSGLRGYHLSEAAYISCREVQIFLSSPWSFQRTVPSLLKWIGMKRSQQAYLCRGNVNAFFSGATTRRVD
jgi:hypothetical protein